MDFGFNHPTASVRVLFDGKNVIVDELLYKSELTSDLIVNELDKLKSKELITNTRSIIADSSRPEIIQEIYKAGYNIKGTKKEKTAY